MADYFSFEDVMHELELGEEELKRMVSEGELRAFRDENKMKFKREDVETLKKGRITEPTIILPSAPPSRGSDETVLDLDIGTEAAALSETSAKLGIPPVEAEEPAPVAAPDEDLVIQPQEDVGTESEETFIEEDTDTGLSTEQLKLADETVEEAVETEAVTETVDEGIGEEAATAAPARRRRSMASIPVAVEEELERKRANPAWTVVIFLAFLTSVYSGFFFYDLMRMEYGRADQPSGTTAGMGMWILEKFWQDAKWREFHERDYPGARPPFEDADERLKHQSYDGPTFLTPRATAPVTDAAAPQ